MLDFSTEPDVHLLKEAIRSSRDAMKPIEIQRANILSAYQGHRFGGSHAAEQSGKVRMSVPLMEIAIDLHAQLIAGQEVRALVNARRDSNLQPLALIVKDAMDLLIETIDLHEVLKLWIKEQMWGVGMIKIGIDFGSSDLSDHGRDRRNPLRMPRPYVDCVRFEDQIIDVDAVQGGRIRFIGNRYLAPLEWAEKNEAWKQEARDDLVEWSGYNDPVGGFGSPLPSQPTLPKPYRDRLYPMVELWDVYLPIDDRFVTVSADGNRALYDDKWRGPAGGPYLLGRSFEMLPTTVLRKPLAYSWLDSHDSVNALYNKAVRQSLRSKRNPIFNQGAEKDAERLRNAEDGEWIGVNNKELIGAFDLQGVDPSLVNLTGQLNNMFSYIASNLNLLGGLSAQSATLGQDQILAQQGSRRIGEIQRRAQFDYGKVLSRLAWYLFRYRRLQVPTRMAVGFGSVPVLLRHRDLKGRFLEFNFSVEPIRYKSAEERLTTLFQVVDKMTRLLPVMAAGGRQLDGEELLNIIRDTSGVPEIDRVFRQRASVPDEAQLNAIAAASRSSGGPQQPRTRRSEAQPEQAIVGS